jgi:two-component system chemotaxis response regulator CheB
VTCPDCGGALWVVDEELLRFRCRVGHAFSPESLFVGKRDALEAALWAAIVDLEERADLSRRLLRRLAPLAHVSRLRYEADIERSVEGAAVLREFSAELIKSPPAAEDDMEGSLELDGDGACHLSTATASWNASSPI